MPKEQQLCAICGVVSCNHKPFQSATLCNLASIRLDKLLSLLSTLPDSELKLTYEEMTNKGKVNGTRMS